MTTGEWISIGEAAKRLDVHPDTIRRWVDDGTLKGKRTRPDGGHRRVLAASVDAHLKATGDTQ